MACCGKGRHAAPPPYSGATRGRLRPVETGRPAAVAPGLVYFEYVGTTGLTVFGPVTGRRYRFSSQGVVQAVAVQDAPSFARLPQVRQMPG